MGFLKKLFSPKGRNVSSEEWEEKRIDHYEFHVETQDYAQEDDELDPKKPRSLWERILFDMRSRFGVLAIGIVCLIGIALPVILHFTVRNNTDVTNFGDCLVKPEYRFQCEINQAQYTLQSLASCERVNGCWDAEVIEGLPYRCYHSIPSAYQYYLRSDFRNVTSKRFNGRAAGLAMGDKLVAEIGPNYDLKERDKKLLNSMTRIQWCQRDVLSIEFYPSEELEPEGCVQDWSGEGERVEGTKEFIVSFEETPNAFFYYRIGRNSSGKDETLFDTRLGPIRFYEHTVTISTSLPSKYFYGLKGGSGIKPEGVQMIDGVSGFGENEIPFYMVREQSGNMHGMLLETNKTFVAQVLLMESNKTSGAEETKGSGITFEIEGDFRSAGSSISLKFFVGPRPEDVLAQLKSYLSKKAERTFTLPPYWGLGLHLCRRTTNTSATLEDILHLNREGVNDTERNFLIPYDTDCITENLRLPLQLNMTNLEEILDKLQLTSKRLLLSQKLTIKNSTVEEMKLIPENMQMFILNHYMNKTFTGLVGNEHVNYLSIFNEEARNWMRLNFEIPGDSFSGVVILENYPMHENASLEYQLTDMEEYRSVYTRNSRIEFTFSNRTQGNVPPRASHMNAFVEGENLFHLDVANIYGEKSLKFFEELVANHENSSAGENERVVVASSSIWTESFLYGAFTGVSAPFSWEGLRSSLSHLLRYFMFAPYGGIPICGNYVDNSSLSIDQDLCLRWYQVGLLLPFARNTYGEDNRNFSRGPLDLNLLYQKHLVHNIQDRYAYNPYYYTQFYNYLETGVPPVVPLSFYFQNGTLDLLYKVDDQFMIGPAIMAAPLVYPGTARSVYFPPGLWYNMEGEPASSSAGQVTVSALINYVPMFIREGHIIPTLMKPVGSSAEESRLGNYTIIATYPKQGGSSTGSLYQDDGVTSEVTEFNMVSFTLSSFGFRLNANCSSAMEIPVSTTIEEIRILGFDQQPSQVISSIDNEVLPRKSVVYFSESGLLRIQNLTVDFCQDKDFSLSWIL